jgi:hypothetical protein
MAIPGPSLQLETLEHQLISVRWDDAIGPCIT